MSHPHRASSPAGLSAAVHFVEPEEKWGFPVLRGEGRIDVEGGSLVLRGKVFRLTAWWLKVGAPVLFLVCIPLHLKMPKVGIWLGLALVLLLVAADAWQRYRGRRYSLRVPPSCDYRFTAGSDTARVRLTLDHIVVNGGSRPPVVAFDIDMSEAKRLALADLLRSKPK